jgi:Flp pilus assembly protein TadG
MNALVCLRVMGKRKITGESGQSLVELALTMPVLLLLLLGAVEFGQAAFQAIQLSNAAKAAAQYGAQQAYTASDVTGMTAIAQQEVPAIPVSVSVGPPTCSCSSPDAGAPSFSCTKAADTACASPSHIVQTLTITVSAPFNPGVFAPGFSHSSFMLYGSAIQKRLQ